MRKRQLKKSPLCKGDYQKKRKKGRQFFRKNRRHRHQMRPRVAPTLVTPPLYSMALSLLLAFSPVFTGVDVVVDRRATELGSVWVWERSSHRLSIRTSLGTRHSVIRRVRVLHVSLRKHSFQFNSVQFNFILKTNRQTAAVCIKNRSSMYVMQSVMMDKNIIWIATTTSVKEATFCTFHLLKNYWKGGQNCWVGASSSGNCRISDGIHFDRR